MTKLIPQQAQVIYIGFFAKPAFTFYSQTDKLWNGLFDIFAPYNVALSDMRNSSTSGNPADQIATVYFGRAGEFKFKFDRIEATVQVGEDFKILPDILSRTDEWLRSSMSEFSYKNHLLAFTSQSKLLDKTSKEFLLGLSSIEIPGIGNSEGNGIIFHWEIPEEFWGIQLTLDHSTTVASGIFIQFVGRCETDSLDYASSAEKLEALLQNALSKIGLETEGIN